MVYSSAITNNTTKRDMSLLARVMEINNQVREYMDGVDHIKHQTLECHSICRALAKAVPDLRLIDGNYIGMKRIPVPEENSFRFELRYATHSWLLTPDEAIIDPYPVGYLAVNPVLVLTKGDYAAFGGEPYVADARVTAAISNRAMWRKSDVLYRIIKAASRL